MSSEYKPEETGQEGATSIQLNDVSKSSGTVTKKKVIYFADGTTMEDDDDDDVTDTSETKIKNHEKPVTKSVASSVNSAPPVDPTTMTWPEWIRHKAGAAGSKTVNVLEGMGGTAAYYLGITTPKYQSEIDEYNRMVTKKKTQEEELMSWSTGPQNQQQPVVEDVKKIEAGEVVKSEK